MRLIDDSEIKIMQERTASKIISNSLNCVQSLILGHEISELKQQ
jgi:hypothetical protein